LRSLVYGHPPTFQSEQYIIIHMQGKTKITRAERDIIEKLQDKGVRFLSRLLHRSPSSISNEIQKGLRNGVYSAVYAQQVTYWRRYKCKKDCMKVSMDPYIRAFVEEKLKVKWSPEQISGELRLQGIVCSQKAIYKFVHTRGLSHLLFWSWNKRKTGIKRKNNKKFCDGRKYIEKRPCIEGLGHYEMDFIVSKKSSSVLLVLTDKVSKYTHVEILPNRKYTTMCDVFSKVFDGSKPLKSITTDNDIAFRPWKRFEELLQCSIYFCNPYHSWEKGLVENTNRWIRCFIPKKKDIATVTESVMLEIDQFINHRPREVLGFRTSSTFY
jgi:transposase, IS30 family